jgi:glycosyltransferase involved in cell wall biosynthesis
MHVSKNRKVILVGDGPARSELVRLVKENGLENDVLFVGFQPNVAHWLSMMDAFVLPSLTEGTPMALLEAMSMGVPVIASAVGGVPKVVKDGLNGFLVEPGNVGQISERLRCLKEDRCLRESVAQAGVETIRTHYDAGRWCVRIQEEYDLLLNRKRSG